METKSFKLPQEAWFNETEMEVALPADWEIFFADIPADALPVLTDAEIEERLSKPTGTATLPELAGNRKKAAIIFDDLSRPTNVAEIAPRVIRELIRAGIKEENISFVAALGAHGAYTRLDFEKKLGREIIEKFPVYNHNPYENCGYAGKTTFGTSVFINREVLESDLKIGIGCILPHAFNGFGGGGKIILPGVSAIETIHQNHKKAIDDLRERGVGFVGNMGVLENSKMQAEIEEVVRMINFDFKIDVLPNSRRQAVELVAGDPILAYKKGVEIAKKLYVTDFYKDADVVVSNAYAKGSEALIALSLGAHSLKKEGGDLVTIVNSPTGQVVHYLFDPFGHDIGGSLWSREGLFPQNIKRNILLSKYPGQRLGPQKNLVLCDEWSKVLTLLLEEHGPKTRAIIYKDATMQFLRKN
ncbi:MAG: DUF2088 domain-containing protein [Dethiobacter sp.]|jgi:nickel-dependent lactate racemase|nr:MAG: DUF2088 domain-containing protein [Dethiobacter sp.]